MKNKKSKIYILIGVFLAILAGFVISFLIVRADPDYVQDTFEDESGIFSLEKVETSTTTATLKLAECYVTDGWEFIANSTVRDINVIDDVNATTSKDIYCDSSNCILYEKDVLPPITVCIATDPYVHANILWRKTDSGQHDYGNATYNTNSKIIYGNEIGGYHETNTRVGHNNVNAGGMPWLNRYYWTGTNMFNAMDKCKTIGPGWRLPTILELDSIRDMKGTAYKSKMPNLATGGSWNNHRSSTEMGTTYAYAISFSGGTIASDATVSKTCSYASGQVRCVRDY